jgi:hypothetical protein
MGTGSGSPRAGIGSRDAEQDEFFGADPRIAPGLPRPIGWRVRMPDGTAAYDKFGPADTDWTPVGTSAGGGGVTQIVAGNNVSISPGGGTGVVTINANGTAATWPLANPRVFAVDGVNGNDAHAGFADAASGSDADYRAACAAAGLVAKKTLAGLAAIFPAIGAGRMAVILIASGTYADSLALVVGGVEGYADGCPYVRGTVTNATNGAVAFSGTTADEEMAGAVTAPGMNAAGYHPLAATAQQLVLGKVGGGSPAFAAEPAVPLGWRVRFDSATTTAVLRGLCRQVSRVEGVDTIDLQTALPVGPANTDTCYLEQAGVVVPDLVLSAPANGFSGLQFIGIRSSGEVLLRGADAHFSLCGAVGFQAQLTTENEVVTDQSVNHPIYGTLNPGGGFRSEDVVEINRGGATLAGMVSATASTFRTMQQLAWGSGCSARNVVVQASALGASVDGNEPPNLGNNAGGIGVPHTFGADAAAVLIDGSDVTLGDLIIVGAGGAPALKVAGTCRVAFAGFVSGTTGNTDVGLDLTASFRSKIALNFALTPTVGGVVGEDIRWSGGAFDVWPSINIQEQYDGAGNNIFLAGTNIGAKTITPSVDVMTNNSGAPTGDGYLFVRQVGASNQFRLAVPGDTPFGVLGTAVNNGAAAIVGPLSGYRVVTFNEAPTLGAFVYVSPANNGKGTTIDPGGQQPLGVVVDTTYALNRALVHFGAATTLPNTAANWKVGIIRVYAVDGVNGDDSHLGYSDAASSSAADYAIACAAAGAVAKKTFAGLGAIFPRLGASRDVEVVIANGGVNTAATYTALDVFLGGIVGGYNKIAVRATGTNTTAGAVAFDGSANDCTYQGGITFTGGNAAGYNPTGAATTTSLPCTLAGGGAAALPAEPGAPLGWRVRFDAATTTVALRNQCRQIAQVVGDTITPQTAFTAAPAAADVFYIEQAGINVPQSVIGYGSNGEGAGANTDNINVTGIRCTGTLVLPSASVRLCFASCNSLNLLGQFSLFAANMIYAHPVRGNLTIGGGLRVEAASANVSLSAGQFTGTGLVSAASVTQTTSTGLVSTWGAGSFVNGTLIIQNSYMPVGLDTGFTAMFGLDVALAAPRVTGRIRILNTRGTFSLASVTGAGANPAITIEGQSIVAFRNVVSGSTGNTDVGLDLTAARESTIILGTQPTVTGTLGDVRLAGGQIITWAQAMLGVVDSKGNRIIGTTAPMGAIKFSGTIVGGAGATVEYLNDAGPGLAANQTTPTRYPTSQRLMLRLRVTSLSNTSANAVTCTLYKNGAPTAMQVSIPAATVANTKFVDSAHPIFFTDGDDFDLRLDDAADVGAIVNVSALLEYAA